jgi:hypothetical protein
MSVSTPRPSSDSIPAVLLASLGIDTPQAQAAVSAGLNVLERFLDAFNARDAQAWARTLHFPHVRFTAGQVQQWASAEDYARSNDIAALADTGWAFTRWDRVLPVHADADKVHFAVRFTRYDAQERAIASFDALYVVTKLQGSWGVQARSSFAGIALDGAAF